MQIEEKGTGLWPRHRMVQIETEEFDRAYSQLETALAELHRQGFSGVVISCEHGNVHVK